MAGTVPPSVAAPALDDSVVVDLVADPVAAIEPPAEASHEGRRLRLDSAHEILVNKLCAILQRSELRDLLDIGALLDLGGDLGRLNAIYLLWRLKESPHWPAIRDALAALSDYLSDESAPIDYARRRDLDYRGLLAQDEWDRICGSLGHQRCSAAHPRSYLQHQIRGKRPLD